MGVVVVAVVGTALVMDFMEWTDPSEPLCIEGMSGFDPNFNGLYGVSLLGRNRTLPRSTQWAGETGRPSTSTSTQRLPVDVNVDPTFTRQRRPGVDGASKTEAS